MPIASPRYPFIRGALEGAPADPGVYALYDNGELVYVGLAQPPSGIQARLLEHFFALREPSEVTHYSWEICRDPATRQTELIREHERRHVLPPRFNRGPTANRRTAA